jgi:hypothetical protein
MINHATAENRPNVVGLQERRLDRTILRLLLFERGREQYRQIPVEVTDRHSQRRNGSDMAYRLVDPMWRASK